MSNVEDDSIKLMLPNESYRKQAEDFRYKFPKDYGAIPGASGIDSLEFDEWLQKCRDVSRGVNLPQGYVPATQYIAVRVSDNKLVGMLQIRHNLDAPHLVLYGGHIGYSVAPEERQKGYASAMLHQGLKLAKRLGITRAMVTCLRENIGSAAVIRNNGGTFTREAANEDKVYHIYYIDNK